MLDEENKELKKKKESITEMIIKIKMLRQILINIKSRMKIKIIK